MLLSSLGTFHIIASCVQFLITWKLWKDCVCGCFLFFLSLLFKFGISPQSRLVLIIISSFLIHMSRFAITSIFPGECAVMLNQQALCRCHSQERPLFQTCVIQLSEFFVFFNHTTETLCYIFYRLIICVLWKYLYRWNVPCCRYYTVFKILGIQVLISIALTHSTSFRASGLEF